MSINHQLVDKADNILSDLTVGGRLLDDQADAFFKQVIDQPTLLKDIRVEGLDSNKARVDKLGLGSRITKKATELQEPTGTKVDLGTVLLDTQEVIAYIPLSYRWLESNIEKAGAEDTLMAMITERFSLDIGELIWNGDTAAIGLPADDLLLTIDGVVKKTTSNIVDAQNSKFSAEIAMQGLMTMPDRYKRMQNQLRLYTHHNNAYYYQLTTSARQTVGGDSALTQMGGFPLFGVPVSPDSQVDKALGLLVNPKNIILGYHRKVTVETDKRPLPRRVDIVITASLDVAIEEETGVVKTINLGAVI